MNITLRKIYIADCQRISEAFQAQGWDKPESQYLEYVRQQEMKLRDVIIAKVDGAFAGYLTISWQSDYLPFKDAGIPEIVDFNVLKKYQRQSIGTSLMDEAERRIMQVSDYAGIGFGLYKDYGAAQILYIKRGYLPDGNGILKDSIPVKKGEKVTIDDSVVFFLTKKLK